MNHEEVKMTCWCWSSAAAAAETLNCVWLSAPLSFHCQTTQMIKLYIIYVKYYNKMVRLCLFHVSRLSQWAANFSVTLMWVKTSERCSIKQQKQHHTCLKGFDLKSVNQSKPSSLVCLKKRTSAGFSFCSSALFYNLDHKCSCEWCWGFCQEMKRKWLLKYRYLCYCKLSQQTVLNVEPAF